MDSLAFAFMSPEMQARIIRQEKEVVNRACKSAVVWDEDTTKFQKLLAIKGKSFDTGRYRLFDSAPIKPLGWGALDEFGDSVVWSPQRNFLYVNRIIPAKTRLELFQGHQTGHVVFTVPVEVPVLASYNADRYRPVRTWMGVTPAEILSQRAGIRKATGHVLLGGLGLGWLLWKVAEKKSVRQITMVEISQELLDWYGYDLCQRVQKETGTPIRVICDDVLTHMGEHGEDVRHLIDIWESYPTYDWELGPAWTAARDKVKHFWGWGVMADPSSRH